jgi:hypothetical protein
MSDREIVEAFWAAMGSSRFDDLPPLLRDGFICEWPHTGERIVGRDNFVEIQRRYPGTGSIEVERLVDDGAGQLATQCRVAWDGTVVFAVSFFTLEGGRIVHLLEWWPEPYEPPAWRSDLVERMPSWFSLPR